jgi:hypothetical protein
VESIVDHMTLFIEYCPFFWSGSVLFGDSQGVPPDKTFPDMRCRECEGLFLVPSGCSYSVSFSNPDCGACLKEHPEYLDTPSDNLKEWLRKNEV